MTVKLEVKSLTKSSAISRIKRSNCWRKGTIAPVSLQKTGQTLGVQDVNLAINEGDLRGDGPLRFGQIHLCVSSTG